MELLTHEQNQDHQDSLSQQTHVSKLQFLNGAQEGQKHLKRLHIGLNV